MEPDRLSINAGAIYQQGGGLKSGSDAVIEAGGNIASNVKHRT